MRIDVHAHYYPADYIGLLIELGRTDLNIRAGQAADFSQRIAALDAAGVQCQILSAIGMDTQIADARGAQQAARFINDAYSTLMRAHPGRLQAWGWVPLPHVKEALEEAARCLDELGFAGIGLACAYQSRPLDDAQFEPFWVQMNRRRATIYIHPVGAHSRCHWGTDRYTLDILCGSPTQETITASRLVFSGVTLRFPDISFIFASCGGTLPFLFPTYEKLLKDAFAGSLPTLQGWVRQTSIDPRDPMAEFRKLYFDTSTQDAPLALLCAKASFGTDRLLLGSDAPHGLVQMAVDYIQSSRWLTDTEKDSILNRNAERLLSTALSKP